MDILETIRTRRSVRKFQDRPIADDLIEKILESGRWAPSGLNNQPWRFAVVNDPAMHQEFAGLTRYAAVIQQAKTLIVVFLDTAESYDRTKDVQAVGACIENMLLAIHALGLGAVWLGEIIKSNEQIKHLLGVRGDLELMAVIALGYSDEKPRAIGRKSLNELVIYRK